MKNLAKVLQSSSYVTPAILLTRKPVQIVHKDHVKRNVFILLLSMFSDPLSTVGLNFDKHKDWPKRNSVIWLTVVKLFNREIIFGYIATIYLCVYYLRELV